MFPDSWTQAHSETSRLEQRSSALEPFRPGRLESYLRMDSSKMELNFETTTLTWSLVLWSISCMWIHLVLSSVRITVVVFWCSWVSLERVRRLSEGRVVNSARVRRWNWRRLLHRYLRCCCRVQRCCWHKLCSQVDISVSECAPIAIFAEALYLVKSTSYQFGGYLHGTVLYLFRTYPGGAVVLTVVWNKSVTLVGRGYPKLRVKKYQIWDPKKPKKMKTYCTSVCFLSSAFPCAKCHLCSIWQHLN